MIARLILRPAQVAIDLAVLSLALWLAFMLRFDWEIPIQWFKLLVFIWPYTIAFQYALLACCGVPRYSWRYVGLRETNRIFMVLGVAASVLLVVRFGAAAVMHDFGYARYALLPIGVTIMDFGGAFLGITGVRVLRRMQAERRETEKRRGGDVKHVRTMLIGAGQAGVMIAKELEGRPDLGILPVGFLDDDRAKTGSVIQGVRVLGTTERLADLCARHRAAQVIITIANAPGTAVRRISKACEAAGIPVKIMPGIYEILGERVKLSRFRDVAIQDLLRREPVDLDCLAISDVVKDKVVLVTGAGGSIGSELCRQVAAFRPGRLVLVERYENNLFNIHRDMLARFPSLTLVPRTVDIRDEEAMRAIFEEHKPAVVFHAAAHKHVPMMEWNPVEAVKNNVFGTKMVADLSDEHGVSAFVMISTDKAVNPTSVMGATKRVAEIYIQALSQRSKTKFVTVRFGNVLGSAGSVVPIFQEQIAKGGPVTITHPDMTRYFMTIPEACQLVLQAGSMGQGGEIFILDMGEPVKIVDLAKDLIELSGLRVGEDVEIVVTGVRPGEKLFEEISVAEEHAEKTRHPKVYVGRVSAVEWGDITLRLRALQEAARGWNRKATQDALKTLVESVERPRRRMSSGHVSTETWIAGA